MKQRWVAPVGDQLRFLANWLEPILTRPGLEPVPVEELCIELGEGDAPQAFEPFDALVGPVQISAEGVVAPVIPVEPFLALRAQIGAAGDYVPHVVLARADGTHTYDPIEAVASEAVLIDSLILV